MGKRGPKPKPTKVLEMRGSRRAKINKNEPKPKRKRPTKPKHFCKRGVQLWNKAARLLMGMGLLTEADGFPLERYIDMLVEYEKARDDLAKNGQIIDVKMWNEEYQIFEVVSRKMNPAFRVFSKLNEALNRLEQEFGLTPSARSRITVPLTDESPYSGTDGEEEKDKKKVGLQIS